VRDGDDYILSGEKTSVTFTGVSKVVFVSARTGGPGPRGLSFFLVPTDLPHVNAMSEVMADTLKRIGMVVDYQATDWGSMLQRLASTEFATQEGTLYPLLSRLRRESLVDYEWRESDTGPPRKYYRLTESGQHALHELQGYWQTLSDTLNRIGK